LEKPLTREASADGGIDFTGTSVLVTGGTGSFGQRFIRTILGSSRMSGW